MHKKLVSILEWIALFFQNLWLKAKRYLAKNEPVRLSESEVPIPDVNIGDTAINPKWRWITVENPNGRRNGNSFHSFGDSAGIKSGATLTVVAVEDARVLVSYQSPKGQGYGAEAGNGTLFFVPKRIFANMTQAHTLVQEEQEERRARVRQLLAEASAQVAPPPSNGATES